MSESTRRQLEEAFELIDNDNYDAALGVLREVIDREPNNADAWWLMANAVDDPREARLALINVLKNDPTHARARQTLDELNDQVPPTDEELKLLIELDDDAQSLDLEELEDPLSDEELFDLFDESSEIDLSAFDEEEPAVQGDDPFEDLFDESAQDESPKRTAKREKKRSSGVLQLVLLLLIAGIVATALFVLSGSEDTAESDPGAPDLAALTVVEEAETTEDVAAIAGRVRVDAARVTGTETATFIVDNGTQTTLFVQSCICIRSDCEGPTAGELPRIVEESFLVVADRVSGENEGAIDQAGVNITDCTGEDVVYRATVLIEDARDFRTSGDMNAFRGSWNVITN
jgi:hypothetical protein